MAWEKGKPRPPGAGRKAGTPNKRTLAEAACARAGIDPFDLLVKGAVEGDMNAIIRLCAHIEPPRKPIEIGVDPEQAKIIVEILDYTSGKK